MHQKYFYRNILTAISVLALAASCTRAQNGAAFTEPQPPATFGPNLVRNGSFEAGNEAWSLQTAKVISSQAHHGKHSLEYHNDDPKSYRLITQDIPAQAGDILHFSAWIKGQNIAPKNLYQAKGAGIFVQSYDAKGSYISGAFPFTLPGTFDWKQVQGIYVVPDNATRVSLGLFLRRESLGTAWFDDVSAQIEKPRLYTTFLQYPNYRGTTKRGNTIPWSILLKNYLPASATGLAAKSCIYDAAGKVLFQENQTITPGKEQTLQWQPPTDLPAGSYRWSVELPSAANEPPQKVLFPIQIKAHMPEVSIDEAGFTVVEGKRFFPFGVYLGKSPGKGYWSSSDENLQRIADAGFNTILDYGHGGRSNDGQEYLSRAAKHQLKVIYSFTDTYDGVVMNPNITEPALNVAMRRVQNLQFAPNLLAWYTNDELGFGELPATRKMYQMLQQTDPDHPVFQVQNKTAMLPWDYYGSDVLGTDPYPATNANSSLRSVTDHTNAVMQAAAGSKAVWQVVQIHDKSFHKSATASPPTLNQMRNMSYQALIGGAKGLIYYAYHWLWLAHDANGKQIFSEAAFQKRWPVVQQMAAEIHAILPVILADQKVLLEEVRPSDAVYQAWQDGNKLYLLVANPDTKNTDIHLQLPTNWQLQAGTTPGITAHVADRNLHIQLDAGASGAVVFMQND